MAVMDERLIITMTIAMALVVSQPAASSPVLANQAQKGLEMMDKPPDPERAMMAEYARVKAKDTAEAFEIFIQRHPDHPLADDARSNLRRLRGD